MRYFHLDASCDEIAMNSSPIENDETTRKHFTYVIRLNNSGVDKFRAGDFLGARQSFDHGIEQLCGLIETKLQGHLTKEPFSNHKQLFGDNFVISPGASPQHNQSDMIFDQYPSSPPHDDNLDAEENSISLEINKSLFSYPHGDYEEGMRYFSDAIKMEESDIFSVSSWDRCMVKSLLCYNIAQERMQQNDYNVAFEYFRYAMTEIENWEKNHNSSLKRSAIDWTPFSIVAVFHNLGYIQYIQGNFSNSIFLFNQALLRARNESWDVQKRNTSIAATLNCIGVLHFHSHSTNNTDFALKLCKESLYIRKTINGFNQEVVATTLNNVGRIHFTRSEFTEAIDVFRDALAIRRQICGDNDLNFGATAYNLGLAFKAVGDLDAAMEMCLIFHQISSAQLGEDHRDTAIVLGTMAHIYHMKKEFVEAERTYLESLQGSRAALGRYHPEVSSTLNKIGNLLYEQGRLDEALKYYEEGLNVERTVLEATHPNIVITLWNIAQILRQKEKHDKSLKVYVEALTLQRASLKMNDPAIAKTLCAMALVHSVSGSYQKSFELYQEALRIRREAFGENHLEVASTLNSIGLLLFKAGMPSHAVESFLESLRIRKKQLGWEHKDVAIVLYNIATVCHERGDDEEAMKCFHETLRIERAVLGPDHSDVLLTMKHIGHLHRNSGRLSTALSFFREALRVERRTLGQNSIVVAQTLNIIGNICLSRGYVDEAMPALSEALRILRMFGADDTQMAGTDMTHYNLSLLCPECAPAA